jgi:glycosyltransferase involved in cell wall biosynthesis
MNDADQAGRRTILIITYAFAPAAYVGVHRTLKYCRYLTRHRWLPVVLTSKPSNETFTDEKLCRQIPPDVEVHRTADFDPVRLLERGAQLKRRDVPAPRAGVSARHSASPQAKPSLLRRLKRAILTLLTQSPDSHVFWLLFALPRGIWVLLTRRASLIYSTSPPHSSHIGAFVLAKLSGKPYVLDFRDPWHTSGPASILGRVKRTIIRNAAKVICVSQGERDELRAQFPELREEHFTYITNGYDPSDAVLDGPAPERSARLTLIHAGTIYPGIAGEFFQALEWLVAHDREAARSMQVQLLGEIAPEYAETIAGLEAAGIVKAHGLQPHGATLSMLRASDVLVILLGGKSFLPSHIPAKVFEYLHAGNPILAIAAEGELARIVRQSGLGTVVPPHSVDRVVAALRALLADHAAGRLARSPNDPYIRSFERAVLAEKLAGVLEGAMQTELARQ